MTRPEKDQLDWNRERDGKMLDAATPPDGEPPTYPIFVTPPEEP